MFTTKEKRDEILKDYETWYGFEIYTKNPETGETGWEIHLVVVIADSLKKAKEILQDYPNFDCIISRDAMYNGSKHLYIVEEGKFYRIDLRPIDLNYDGVQLLPFCGNPNAKRNTICLAYGETYRELAIFSKDETLYFIDPITKEFLTKSKNRWMIKAGLKQFREQ